LFDEARAIIGSHEEDIANWFAWRDDWPDWQPAANVPGLDEVISRALPNPSPTLPVADGPLVEDGGPKGLMSDELSLSVAKDVLSLDKLRTEEDTSDSFVVRAKKRHKKRYAITIEVNDKIFKTHSHDISVGGVYVEDIIPDWVTGYFKIRVGKQNSKQQIELQCCLVEGQAPHARYRIMILPLQNASDELNLENWLAA
jgi:hypothetical protein